MMNINENPENEEMQNYDNYQYRENIEEMENVTDDIIKNENEAQIQNFQEEDNNNINNIQSNIEIFEDASNHIEEINENQENFKDENQNY